MRLWKGRRRLQGAQGVVGGPLGDAPTPGPRLQGSLLFLRNRRAAPAARLERGALAAKPAPASTRGEGPAAVRFLPSYLLYLVKLAVL